VHGYFGPFYVAQSVTFLGCSDSVETHRTNSLLSRPGFFENVVINFKITQTFFKFYGRKVVKQISTKNLPD